MIEFPANGGTGAGYLALPDPDIANGRGVIVIQEWWGLVPHIKDVADRFAAEGYVALAPDFMEGEHTTNPDEAGRLMMAIGVSHAEKQLRGAIDALQSEAGIDGRVGVIGFCMGGQLAMLAATTSDNQVGAAVNFYGIHPNVKPDFSRLSCPIMGFFGDEDGFVSPSSVEQLARDIDAAGGEFDYTIYPGAGHAFFNDTRPEAYEANAASDAWERTLSFLADNLEGEERVGSAASAGAALADDAEVIEADDVAEEVNVDDDENEEGEELEEEAESEEAEGREDLDDSDEPGEEEGEEAEEPAAAADDDDDEDEDDDEDDDEDEDEDEEVAAAKTPEPDPDADEDVERDESNGAVRQAVAPPRATPARKSAARNGSRKAAAARKAPPKKAAPAKAGARKGAAAKPTGARKVAAGKPTARKAAAPAGKAGKPAPGRKTNAARKPAPAAKKAAPARKAKPAAAGRKAPASKARTSRKGK